MKCAYCNGNRIVKRGKQKTKRIKQIYYCKDCNKRFIDSGLRGKAYDAIVILNAISYYNLGNSLEESVKLINKQFKIKASKSSVSNWLNEYKHIYSYHRFRDNVLREYNRDVLASRLFRHKGLTYNYKYHKAKLDLFCRYDNLASYLKSFEENFPHDIFEKDERGSQIRIDINVLKKEKNNYACKLAKFALNSINDNKKRHNLIENFMLINDTATIAVEVPVWFWEKNLYGGIGICGHIDILQLRYGKIYVLDFKPDAVKENEKKVVSQLYLYSLGLSFRTGIMLENFRCAWFDDESYFEFNPNNVEVRW